MSEIKCMDDVWGDYLNVVEFSEVGNFAMETPMEQPWVQDVPSLNQEHAIEQLLRVRSLHVGKLEQIFSV